MVVETGNLILSLPRACGELRESGAMALDPAALPRRSGDDASRGRVT